MPTANSIDPLRILPTQDATSLSHDLNRVLDRITQHLNNRYGFSGPVAMYAGVDFRGNVATNVGTSATPSDAATVEQLRQIEAQLGSLTMALAVLASQGPRPTSFVLLVDGPGAYSGQAGKGVRVDPTETRLEYVTFALLTDIITAFTALSDTDDSYAGHAGHVVTVRTDETGLTFAAISGGAPLDQTLQALADLVTSADTMPYFTGVDTASLTPLTAFIRTLLDDPNAATARGTLGLQALAILNTVGTAQIDDGAVTFAKIQGVTNQRLLGRSNATTGPPHEITIGAGLSLDDGQLIATGTGGGGEGGGTSSRRRIFMHMGS